MSASCRWVCSWSPSESIAMVDPVLKPPGLPTDTDHLQTSPSSSPFSPPLPSIPDTGLHRTWTIHVWSAAGQMAAVCISPCLISVRQRWSFWHTMSLCLRQSVIQTRRLVWARMQSICSVDRALGSCVRIQSGRRNAHIHIYLMLLQTHTCAYIHTATQLTGLNTIRERSVTQPVNRFLQKPRWLNGSFYLGRASWLLLITSLTHTHTQKRPVRRLWHIGRSCTTWGAGRQQQQGFAQQPNNSFWLRVAGKKVEHRAQRTVGPTAAKHFHEYLHDLSCEIYVGQLDCFRCV